MKVTRAEFTAGADGATTGDWTWLIVVAILGVVLWIGFKAGLVRSLND